LWEDGSLTWEPMALIWKDDPIKLALYVKKAVHYAVSVLVKV